MSRQKIGALVLYAVLAALAITQAGTLTGTAVNWAILAMVVIHALEVVVLLKSCRDAGGPLLGQMPSVFVLSNFHVEELKACAR